jgi:hypothetical protein
LERFDVIDSIPANDNTPTPPNIAMVEYIDGVGDTPMISTANLRINQMVGIIRRIARDTLNSFPKGQKPASFSIEFIDTADLEFVLAPTTQTSPLKIPKGSEHIAEYFGNQSLRHLELVPDKILSIDELHLELMSLTEWEITFQAVTEILLKRWFRCSPAYFQDRQVATLVQYLLDPDKRKRVLNLLKTYEFGSSNPHF